MIRLLKKIKTYLITKSDSRKDVSFHDEYFSWVNSKLVVRNTAKIGKGVFAREDIAKEEILVIYGGFVISNYEEKLLPEPFNDHGVQIHDNFSISSKFKDELENYFNHSCEPNAGYNGQIFLVAMRDIKRGEEVTFDYAMVLYRENPNDPYEMHCQCGCANCRGIVTDNDWQLPELRERYKGYFQWYLQEKINREVAMDIEKFVAEFQKKYIGSCCGNTFVIIDCRDANLKKNIKSAIAQHVVKKYNVDSALFIKRSNGMSVYMEIFEGDGTESESCGNGAILVAYHLKLNEGTMEMKDNAAIIAGDDQHQSITMSLKFAHAKMIDEFQNCVYVKMGEPHVVFIVDDLQKFDLVQKGAMLQSKYAGGVNVDVLQKIDDSHYLIRTYERGVFAETKSCGTGSLSSYIGIACLFEDFDERPMIFTSEGGEHTVSREGDMLKLATLKKNCAVRSL